jgi:hypothetical protein
LSRRRLLAPRRRRPDGQGRSSTHRSRSRIPSRGSSPTPSGSRRACPRSEIAGQLGVGITTSTWTFFNRNGLEPARINFEDQDRLDFSERDGENRNSIRVDLSDWHTGNEPMRIVRDVAMAVGNRPLDEVFRQSVEAKYGEPSFVDPALFRDTLFWTYSGGERSETCQVLEVPRRIIEAYGMRPETTEGFLARLDSGEACDAVFEIHYRRDGAGQVTEYTVTAIDFRRLLMDVLNDRRVSDAARERFAEAARAANTVTPDL